MYRESTMRKLESALQQVQILERMSNGNVPSDQETVTTVIAKLRKLVEEAYRFADLDK